MLHFWVSNIPINTVVYPGSKLEDIQSGILYVSESVDQVAFDSFIMADGYFYIFRFWTRTGSDHSNKRGIISFFSHPSPPPKTMWRFVFMIPTGSAISCSDPCDPGLEDLLKEMEMFCGVGS